VSRQEEAQKKMEKREREAEKTEVGAGSWELGGEHSYSFPGTSLQAKTDMNTTGVAGSPK